MDRIDGVFCSDVVTTPCNQTVRLAHRRAGAWRVPTDRQANSSTQLADCNLHTVFHRVCTRASGDDRRANRRSGKLSATAHARRTQAARQHVNVCANDHMPPMKDTPLGAHDTSIAPAASITIDAWACWVCQLCDLVTHCNTNAALTVH